MQRRTQLNAGHRKPPKPQTRNHARHTTDTNWTINWRNAVSHELP
jgi:hypothetical protein